MPSNKRQKDSQQVNRKKRAEGEVRRESIEQIRRRHEKKQRQKKIKRRIAGTVIVTILLAVALCCVAFLTPFFLIDHVTIDGNKKVAQKEISQVAAIDLGQNTFSLNLNQVEKRLEKIPYIKKADIRRKLPKGIHIQITERQIFCYLKSENMYYAVDRDGQLLENPKELDAHFLCVEGVNVKSAKVGEMVAFENPSQFRELVMLTDKLKSEKVSPHVSKINFSDADNITFFYDNRLKINFGDVDEVKRKIEYIKNVAKSEQRSGSIRFDMDDGKIYFTAD